MDTVAPASGTVDVASVIRPEMTAVAWFSRIARLPRSFVPTTTDAVYVVVW
jgi:hypothetical protein